MTMAEFCYPYKTSLLYFIDAIYFDIEKEVSDENVIKIKQVVEIIKEDMISFIEIQQRVTAQKGGTGQTRRAVNEGGQSPDVKDVKVDINMNFNLATAFGSQSLATHMEEYVF